MTTDTLLPSTCARRVVNKMFLSLLLTLSANAQVGTVTPLMTKDLPDVPGKEGLLITVDFAPGEVVASHRHDSDVFAYVVAGSIITQLKGGRPQTIHAGEAFYESPTDVHIASRNASRTRPAKLLVFFVKAKGVPPTVVLGKGNASY
jgi:quercetin dioxygenase-like cupin family protein